MADRHLLDNAKKSTLSEISDLIDRLDFSQISEKNPLYRSYQSNKFLYFVEMELKRYEVALQQISQRQKPNSSKRTLDLGCMVPILPLWMSKLGYQVTIVDNYEYYGSSFLNEISQFCNEHHISVLNANILDFELDFEQQFDVVLNLAVVEHFNGSPLTFMRKVYDFVGEGGFLVFDVPNIASLTKRIRLLLGNSPLDEYTRYLFSPYPYFGHNREMTIKEVRLLLEASGFKVDNAFTFNFNQHSTRTLSGEIVRRVGDWPIFRNCGENIIAVCSKT